MHSPVLVLKTSKGAERMITKLYNWTMEKAASKAGEKWLAFLALIESVFFPIPVDVMLIPMIIADRSRAWRLATIVTTMSVIGAGLGYIIGAFFYETVAAPIIELYGYGDKFDAFQDYYTEYGVWIVLIGGLTPIPFKVITISSGLIGMNPFIFMLSCIPARVPRFFLEAALLWKYGAAIQGFIEKRLGLMFTLGIIVFLSGFVALKYI